MKLIEVPGHGEVEFPDEMSDQAIAAAIQKNILKPQAQKSDYGDILGSPTEQVLAGVGRGMTNTARGVGQALGLVDQGTIDEAKRLDQPLMNSGYGKTGDVIGTIASTLPAMAVPGANTVAGGTLLGGALGAAQPVATGESRLTNTGTGAAGGLLGSGLAKGLGRVFSPETAAGPKALLGEGVELTPGQILGGGWKALEEKLTSVPGIGDMIGSGQRRAQESFNKAAYARALKGIGKTPEGAVGREGVADVSEKLGAAYDELLPQLKFQADPQFATELQKIQQMAAGMPPQQAKQFERILQDQLIGKMTPNGLMNGESLKSVESELGRMAKGYKGDAAFDNRQLGDAISAVQDSIRQNLMRTNPAQAGQLAKINEGYANYARIRDAASRQGSNEGVFSPAQLAAAVRAGDKSAGKGNFAKGQALMQDLSDTGKSTIGNKYPDSGSIGRLLLAGGLGAGGLAVSPATVGGVALSSLLYTKPGQKLAAALLAGKRPELLKKLGEGAKAAAPAIGTGGAALAIEGQ